MYITFFGKRNLFCAKKRLCYGVSEFYCWQTILTSIHHWVSLYCLSIICIKLGLGAMSISGANIVGNSCIHEKLTLHAWKWYLAHVVWVMVLNLSAESLLHWACYFLLQVLISYVKIGRKGNFSISAISCPYLMLQTSDPTWFGSLLAYLVVGLIMIFCVTTVPFYFGQNILNTTKVMLGNVME